MADDVPSIVLNGLNNKHQSFWEDTTYEDELTVETLDKYSNDNTPFILNLLLFLSFFLSLGTRDVEFFFPGNFRYILHAIAIEDFSQLENCKYILIFIIVFAGKLRSLIFFCYHTTSQATLID